MSGKGLNSRYGEHWKPEKVFNSLICCEWKMASDKLDFGGVSV